MGITPDTTILTETTMNSLTVFASFAVFLCLCISTSMASPMPDHPHAHHAPHAHPKYAYGYAVNDHDSGNNFGQSESRDGGATSGSYYVALPDGRTQKVVYTVNGDAGYIAEVTYSK